MKEGRRILYNFVWRLRDGRPAQLVPEFTVEEDSSALIALVEQLGRNQ
jgi:hypothetical protein